MIERTKDPVTFGEVCDAIEDIVARGENPTIARVRSELGDRGSNTTITKYIRAWKDNYDSDERVALTKTDKTGIVRKLASENIHQLVDKIWEQLRNESEASNARIKQEAKQAIEDAHREKEKIDIERVELISTLDRLNKEMSELELSNQDLKKILDEKKRENDIVNTQLKNAKELYTEMVKQKDKVISEATTTNKNINNQLESLRNQKAKELDEIRTVMENQRHKYMAELETKKTEIGKLSSQYQKIEILKQKTDDDNGELREHVKQCNKQLHEKTLQYEKQTKEHNNLQNQLTKSNTQKEHYENQFAELRIMYQELLEKNKQEVKNYEERIGRMDEQIKQLKQSQAKSVQKNKVEKGNSK